MMHLYSQLQVVEGRGMMSACAVPCLLQKHWGWPENRSCPSSGSSANTTHQVPLAALAQPVHSTYSSKAQVSLCMLTAAGMPCVFALPHLGVMCACVYAGIDIEWTRKHLTATGNGAGATLPDSEGEGMFSMHQHVHGGMQYTPKQGTGPHGQI